MASLTFANDFHRTSATLRVPANMLISVAQERNLARALCGFAGCECGGLGAIRGGAFVLEYTRPDGGPYRVLPRNR